MSSVYTSYTGNNDILFGNIAEMFLKDGDSIADVTYGKGAFWKKIDTTKYNFYPSDKITCPKASYDFCHLPYAAASFDVAVFDPPYTHNPGRLIVNDSYQNAETTKGMYHDDITELYRRGMKEAVRILKYDGTLWVKCKDEVESSIQRWSHIEILLIANSIGLYAIDLFIVTQSSAPVIQYKNQKHARKNHSYLWIFKKVKKDDKRFKVQKQTIRNVSCKHKKS